ncbi:hypothetical protein H0H81_007959 [Sphagnurus paluster]|uniref:Uncharacterized protein n=1 Tax=Sphagnurus paluster TaxID=117069 RepID=A0A9P7GKV2_9AGAR|nr:hypothetical protein H0H81_007959 [Sphagnurus paluster]
MPQGFPFKRTHDCRRGVAYSSYESFDFLEDLAPSSSRQQYRANISFRRASPRDRLPYFTWQAHLSSPDGYFRKEQHPAAHVQIHHSVENVKAFWNTLRDDPSVIMRALALSLELGALVTIDRAEPSSNTIIYNIIRTNGARPEPYLVVRH